ncbi:unnamed protein product [Dibothriocephalus latus]|uniref:Uncharacterized protein n=1 Tax=Dibothriocephalus latus TaxID=60516 RepID=A0A3P6SVI3_DIBLA|nr:unnamed protein product [Dibothriocephalus latus]
MPAFGENKAFYLVFTLDEKWDYGYIPSQSQSVRRQVLLRSSASGGNHLPWFLCNHAPTEDKNELLEVLLLAYMQRMALDMAEREPESYNFHSNLPKELEKCELDYHEMGCLEDKVNCDNAWINVTAIHIQVPGSYRFWELLPQLFAVKDVEAKWEILSSLPPVRESHLQAIAVFNEKLIRA